jgi:Na+/H+ antiporter NhaA
MFAMSDDELLFDEVLNSGLHAELLRVIGVDAPLDALAEAADPVQRLDRCADDMWSAYTTPPVRH